jgi:3-methyl-2-oxobutanoate hydroxymethyltransferase
MKKTILDIQKTKNENNNKKIVAITASDFMFSRLFDGIVDIILVGDSLNMSFKNENNTISNCSLSSMIYHAKAVQDGVKNAFLVCDMPFGTYGTKKQAFKNASKILKKTNVDAIKIEGGKTKAKIIKFLSKNNIPVMAHIGLMPQKIKQDGKYSTKGISKKDRDNLIKDAKAIQKAGAFCVVLEKIESSLAKQITDTLKIPTIGIGSGKELDGQILVYSDILGFFENVNLKFAKKYIDGATIIKDAISKYANEVRNGAFPDDKHI